MTCRPLHLTLLLASIMTDIDSNLWGNLWWNATWHKGGVCWPNITNKQTNKQRNSVLNLKINLRFNWLWKKYYWNLCYTSHFFEMYKIAQWNECKPSSFCFKNEGSTLSSQIIIQMTLQLTCIHCDDGNDKSRHDMKSFIAKRVYPFWSFWDILRFKLPRKYKENNKKICNTFDHNFKNAFLYI